MWLVKLGDENQKREVMEENVEGKKKEKIMDNLTWKERKMKWKLEDSEDFQIAKREEGRGRRVWISNRKLRIEGEWWIWDEEEKVLRDRGGNLWRKKVQREEREEESGERKQIGVEQIEGGGAGGGREEVKVKESGKGWKICFWNVAGLGNKDKNFWGRIREIGCSSPSADVGGGR